MKICLVGPSLGNMLLESFGIPFLALSVGASLLCVRDLSPGDEREVRTSTDSWAFRNCALRFLARSSLDSKEVCYMNINVKKRAARRVSSQRALSL